MTRFYIIYILIPLCAGYILDLLFGDPLSRFHPVVLIGRLISLAERRYYNDDNNEWNVKAGVQTVVIVCAVSVMVPVVLIIFVRLLFGLITPAAGKAAASLVSSLLCWQMLAAKSLKTESMKVYDSLNFSEEFEAAAGRSSDEAGVHDALNFSEQFEPVSGRNSDEAGRDSDEGGRDSDEAGRSEQRLEEARRAVSMIVGRDTEHLDEAGIIRATVETVAENTCDGVIAPMFFMALLGIPGLFFYKAVNTMDSMIGYKNERYLYYGRAAARTDDVLNFIPARLSGLALILAACIHRECDGRNAFAVFCRDRGNSSSPNAGCGEAAAAGALHVRLLGPASYFGVIHDKPYIGTDDRPIESEDIRRVNELMYVASVILLLSIIGCSGLIGLITGSVL